MGRKLLPSLKVLSLLELVKFENRISKIKRVTHEWRPFFERDLSIIYLDPGKVSELERILFFLIEELCGYILVDLYELFDKRTEYLGQPNHIYRLVWQSWRIPLSRKLCNSVHEELKLMLSVHFTQQHLEMIVT